VEKSIRAAPAAALLLGCLLANAQETTRSCAAAEVRSIRVTAESGKFGAPPETIDIARTEDTLVARGPVLGSMDSRQVETDLACTPNGVLLTATITRSADYNGSAAKNVLWRPRIEIAIVLRQTGIVFQTKWRMRSSTGAELSHAQTPPYPDRQYPLVVTITLPRP
jgi:hypothetical protein